MELKVAEQAYRRACSAIERRFGEWNVAIRGMRQGEAERAKKKAALMAKQKKAFLRCLDRPQFLQQKVERCKLLMKHFVFDYVLIIM